MECFLKGTITIATIVLFYQIAFSAESSAVQVNFILLGSVYMPRDDPGPKIPRVPITYDPRFLILVKVEKVISSCLLKEAVAAASLCSLRLLPLNSGIRRSGSESFRATLITTRR
jgi:hypothetical protein